MTKDEALRAFNKEIDINVADLEFIREEFMKLKSLSFSNPIIFDKRFSDLYIRRVVVEDRLKSLTLSRDRLLEVMTNECL